MIDKLIRKLGKPKSFLVMFAICLMCAVFALLVLLLHFSGLASLENISPKAVLVFVPIFLSMWLTLMVCMGVYYVGQLSGKYSDLEGRGWGDLPW